MEAADIGCRCADWSKGAPVDGAVDRGRGRRGRVPPSYAPASRRLPLRPPGSLPHLTIPAPLPSAPWDQPVAEGKPDKNKIKSYAIGYFHSDIAEVRTEQGKLHLFVAIDRTSKFAFVELHDKATTRVSGVSYYRLRSARCTTTRSRRSPCSSACPKRPSRSLFSSSVRTTRRPRTLRPCGDCRAAGHGLGQDRDDRRRRARR